MEIEVPLVLFTFFTCMASGLFLTQGVLTLMGKGKKLQLTMLIASLVTLAIGGISVFFHLQHPLRMLNGFGHITSGITIELIFIVIFAIVLVLYFLMMRRSEEGVAPKWCAVLAVIIGVALPFAMGDSYLMPAIPVWDTILLPIYYVVDAVLLGGLVALVLAAVRKAEKDEIVLIAKIALIGAVAVIVVNVVYAFMISGMSSLYTSDIDYYFDPTLPDVAMRETSTITSALISGSLAGWFWLGTIVVGLAVPAVLAFMVMSGKLEGKELVGGALATVCAIFGAFVWRVCLYVIAVNALIQFQL